MVTFGFRLFHFVAQNERKPFMYLAARARGTEVSPLLRRRYAERTAGLIYDAMFGGASLCVVLLM